MNRLVTIDKKTQISWKTSTRLSNSIHNSVNSWFHWAAKCQLHLTQFHSIKHRYNWLLNWLFQYKFKNKKKNLIEFVYSFANYHEFEFHKLIFAWFYKFLNWLKLMNCKNYIILIDWQMNLYFIKKNNYFSISRVWEIYHPKANIIDHNSQSTCHRTTQKL